MVTPGFLGSKYNENDQAIIRKYMDSAVQDTSQYRLQLTKSALKMHREKKMKVLL